MFNINIWGIINSVKEKSCQILMIRKQSIKFIENDNFHIFNEFRVKFLQT